MTKSFDELRKYTFVTIIVMYAEVIVTRCHDVSCMSYVFISCISVDLSVLNTSIIVELSADFRTLRFSDLIIS